MNKIVVTIIIAFLLMQCNTSSFIPPANKYDIIKDRFYYTRDTLNFYQVEISDYLAESLDSIFDEVPLESENHFWTIYFYDKFFYSISGELTQTHCEESFILIESTKTVYKAVNIDGRNVIIIDPYNAFSVIQEKPFIQIRNPREIGGIYNHIGIRIWSLKLDRKGELISVEEY